MSPAPKGALAAEVTRELRNLILSGELRPSRRLIVAELADRFATSHGPVRDALRRLQAEGLVVPHGRQGVQVATMTADDARETITIRQALEPVAARLAMASHLEELTGRLTDALAEIRTAASAGDWSTIVTADMMFHDVFYQCSHSPRLQQIWAGMRLPVLHTFRLHRLYYSSIDELRTEHEHLLDLVRMGNPDLVALALHQHVAGLVDDLVAWLSTSDGDADPRATARKPQAPPA